MGLRRGYVVALAVAIIAGVVSIVMPRNTNGLDPEVRAEQAALANARRRLPEAMADLQRLAAPADFRRVDAGCRSYRCYVVPERTERVAPELLGMLRSIGALNAETRRLQARVQSAGDSVAGVMAPDVHGSGASGLKMVGCNTAANDVHGSWTYCAYPAVIADNVIVVFLSPYLACDPGPCRWTNESEVNITLPSGARQS